LCGKYRKATLCGMSLSCKFINQKENLQKKIRNTGPINKQPFVVEGNVQAPEDSIIIGIVSCRLDLSVLCRNLFFGRDFYLSLIVILCFSLDVINVFQFLRLYFDGNKMYHAY
jgi:hypothetical protein